MSNFEPIKGYQRAVVKTSKRTGGTIRRPDLPARYTAHVTVGVRLYDYPWPPHFTVAWGGGRGFKPGIRLRLSDRFINITGPNEVTLNEKDVLRLQHCDILKGAYALVGPGAPPRASTETNYAGHNIQCEFTLPAVRSVQELKKWEYGIIAREIANQIHGLRLALNDPDAIDPKVMVRFYGSEAWGYNNPRRMSEPVWEQFNGIATHATVPGNSHWDVGKWRRRYIRRRVKRRLKALGLRDFPQG